MRWRLLIKWVPYIKDVLLCSHFIWVAMVNFLVCSVDVAQDNDTLARPAEVSHPQSQQAVETQLESLAICAIRVGTRAVDIDNDQRRARLKEIHALLSAAPIRSHLYIPSIDAQ